MRHPLTTPVLLAFCALALCPALLHAGTAEVTVTAATQRPAEPTTASTFTFSRTGNTSQVLTVNFTVAGTATEGGDYQAIGTTVTIQAGSATATVTVTPIDDITKEGDETVIVTVAAGSYTVGSPSSATLTITDDDIPIVTIAGTDAQAAEPSDTATFTVTSTPAPAADLTVNLSISGTATNTTDYSTIASTVMILAGQTSATVTVTPVDDTAVEGDETVIIDIAAGGANYSVGSSASATATIADNDSAPPGSGGFRFLTTGDLPRATRSSAYSYTLLVAHAAGEVTFGVSANQTTMDTLSLTIDPKTGHISGIIPAGAGNAAGDPVTFFADDGVTRIFYPTMISTTSAGGSDFGFAVSFTSLPNGEVGTDYAPVTVPIQGGSFPTSGLTNIRFGAADLPPGLSMNGLTGVISGNPTAAGTYYVTITAVDREKSMEAVVVVPLLVYPKGSTFKFDTVILDNGEVNVAYNYQVLVSGQQGSGGGLSYSASGLPPGVDINPDTGLISGTPTAAGTFNVIVTAGKGNENIQINRPLVIVPNGTNFFWQYSGQPAAAFLNTTYGAPNNPTFVLNTQPAGVYSAVGLPPGITYNSASGELSGVATEVGIYPVTFTATDSASGAQITFTYEYIVFPPNGGDTNSLPINIWVKKMAFKRGSPGKDSWQAQWIYNADRRLTTNPVRIYDASTDPLVMSLGSIPEVNIPRASLTGSRPKFAYKAGAISAKLDESAQTIALTDKSLTINDRYKTTLENRVRLGQKAYILDLYFDDKGKFTPALGYRKTAFVASSIKASVKAATKDSASFSMLLGSPSFVYPATGDVKTVLFRLYNSSGTLVVEKDFTSIVTFTTATDKATGAKVYKLKSGKDAAAPVGKFSYDSKSGKMTVAFKGLSLGGLLTAAEEQVSIEMQIADKTYYTGVTIFAPKAGSYSTKLPK